MGADIRILGRDALIQGGKPLTGTFVRAQELRGGAALILAHWWRPEPRFWKAILLCEGDMSIFARILSS